MKVQQIAVAESYPSRTNPRGEVIKDRAFADLVASIKEKGVLVPVIARPDGKGKIEVVAGSRRLTAAKEAGLEKIPADLREMDDAEAREVQIIENLQRADVHPLDEGEAYRQLHEESGQEIKSIAAKVGKSDDYVRQRLFLTNLGGKARQAYRSGKLLDGHAALIARLDLLDQNQALKFCLDRYDLPTVKQLEDQIRTAFYKPLASQPWLKDPEMIKIVGPCQECPPSRSSLFGDLKEGECTTLKCWQRKMDAYIGHRAKTEKLVKVSKEYSHQEKRGILYENQYHGLSTKVKEHCEFAEQGIVAEGRDLGTVIWLCRSSECKKHNREMSSGYKRTPREIAARKRELAKAAAKERAEFKVLEKAAKKMKWPMTEKQLEALVMITLTNGNSDPQRSFVKGKGYEILRTKGSWDKKDGNGHPDYRKTLEAEFAKLKGAAKVQLLFEVLLHETANWDGRRTKIINAIAGKA